MNLPDVPRFINQIWVAGPLSSVLGRAEKVEPLNALKLLPLVTNNLEPSVSIREQVKPGEKVVPAEL
jgi:hypothetical protein